MGKRNLTEALNKVELTYQELVDIGNDLTSDIFPAIDAIIDEIRDNAAGISVESLRDYMVRLQLRAYELSDIKERSALKAECAEALRKERYAEVFNASEGTAGVKDNTAFLASSEEMLIEALYNLVANRFKTKLDELHRMISVLQSILMSKMQEAKLSMNGIE